MKIPLDKEKITERIKDIEKSFEKLKEYQRMNLRKFQADETHFALASYWLRIALEAVLVIGIHILSRLPYNGREKDYTQIILSLGDYNVIPKKFAQKIKGMAGYRNRLVHLYWKISSKEILTIIKENLNDFNKFIKYIEKFIRNEE